MPFKSVYAFFSLFEIPVAGCLPAVFGEVVVTVAKSPHMKGRMRWEEGL